MKKISILNKGKEEMGKMQSLVTIAQDFYDILKAARYTIEVFLIMKNIIKDRVINVRKRVYRNYMKVYIRKGNDNEFESMNCYLAYDGFKKMGWEIIFYTDIKLVNDNKPENVIVGHIGDIHYSLKKFGCEIPALCYPEELKEYLGRRIWKSTLFKIANNPENWGIFIKPVYDAKRFTGVVVNSTRDLINCGGSLGDTDIWCSDVVNFVTEWRCYVRNGEILDIRRYKGDWKQHFDSRIVEEAIHKYENSPKGYGIDFGVTDKGETLIIEVNDGYSLGSYGIESINYAKLLSARWSELTGTKDECDF